MRAEKGPSPLILSLVILSLAGRGELAGDVVVADTAGEAGGFEALHQFAREDGRAMASAGASEAYSQVALALALIERNQEIKQAAYFVDEALRLGLRHHVFVDARVSAGEWPQLGDEKWIRNEPHVEHYVHPNRQA